jgi:hypothetical protein
MILVTLALVAICAWKGEPAKWRSGNDVDAGGKKP